MLRFHAELLQITRECALPVHEEVEYTIGVNFFLLAMHANHIKIKLGHDIAKLSKNPLSFSLCYNTHNDSKIETITFYFLISN